VAKATGPKRRDVEAWKRNPWFDLPTWAKWVVAVAGVVLVVVLGVLTGWEIPDEDGGEATSVTTTEESR
jgi:hypothetical protein